MFWSLRRRLARVSGRGGQEDLHVRVGEHDGPDVAALDDHTARAGGQVALALHQPGARRALRIPPTPPPSPHHHGSRAETSRQGKAGPRRVVAETGEHRGDPAIASGSARPPRRSTASVTIRYIARCRGSGLPDRGPATRHRRLSGPGRTVDGDHDGRRRIVHRPTACVQLADFLRVSARSAGRWSPSATSPISVRTQASTGNRRGQQSAHDAFAALVQRDFDQRAARQRVDHREIVHGGRPVVEFHTVAQRFLPRPRGTLPVTVARYVLGHLEGRDASTGAPVRRRW